MANVQVAVRVRPLSKRETKEGGRIIVEVDDKVAKIRNVKVDSRPESFGDTREKVVAFGFDYCYWSVNPEDPHYASQEVVFRDLGTEVLSGAAKGYNICLFAYGQTGSGKTYTMLGTPASVGLTPRICEGLFIREDDCASQPCSRSIKVSFLEIYNERVRDLLKQSNQNKSYTLRVREHPEMGPYVQGLSQHVVTNYQQVIQLLEAGIANRITAATHVHEASSRSHAIFTIHCTQAILQNNLPSETASKINLVDLAGSERADPSYCKDRITEGANINKSLVTLGIVISTLAQNSQVFSSCQSLSSAASSGGDSGVPSTTSGASSGGGPARRQSYIPYRDSVLTWLLKESLGGNSKTIMVATVSPAHTSYSETMSTMRYASNAKNIINKPRVNEDANVKLIRELREEIERLKAVLLNFELRNFSSLNDDLDESLQELVFQSDLKIDTLTQHWTEKRNDRQALMEHYGVDINRKRARVVIDSSLPHLMALEDDVLSTGVVLYHLKEGTTKIGRIDSDQEQDIVLQGQWIERDHCTITSTCGVVILRPTQGARCTVNGREVTASCRLTQGAVITLGKAQKFRFNHPAEAAVLRHQRLKVGEALGSSGSLEWLDLDGDVSASRLGLCPVLRKERRVLEEQCDRDQQPSRHSKIPYRAQPEQQQCHVEALKQQAKEGQSRVQKELELDHTHISQQIKDNQQWLLTEETWLASLRETQQEGDCGEEKELEASVAPDAWLPTVPQTPPSPLVQSQKRVVQPQYSPRHTTRATVWNIRQKKVSFQLERIIKKRRLLEAQRRLEQLSAFFWIQDDGASRAPSWTSSSNTSGPGSQRRSRWTTCSSLSLQRLCSRRLPQLHSDFMNWDPSAMSPPVPELTHQMPEKTLSTDCIPPRAVRLGRNSFHSSRWRKFSPARRASTQGTRLTVSHKSVSSQEIESLGKQPCQMSSQGQSTKKQKARDGSRTFIPAAQTRWAKGLVASVNTKTGWQKEGTCGTYKDPKETTSQSTDLSGLEPAAGHRKVVKTFQAESKPSPSSRTSKKHQRALAARARDIVKTFSRLPHGGPLKNQPRAGDPGTPASFTDSRPIKDPVREEDRDLSDTESSYSVDSLSYIYAKVPKKLLKPEDLQGKWNLPDSENSESDNSQISEDSLAGKGHKSLPENSRGEYSIKDHGHSRARTSASVRGLPMPSDSSLCTQKYRSFSLDSLIDPENRQGEPFLGSADEMPTETFWHLQNATPSSVDQEAMDRPSPTNHRMGVGVNVLLPKSNSFYLDPQFQPPCEQLESEMEASYSEHTNPLRGLQLSRESPLLSVDSWFSCDSKVSPSSPSGDIHSLCPSPDIHEIQPHDEKPKHWLSIEEPKPPGTCKLPQSSTEPPCSSDLYATSASDTSKPSVCESQGLLQPGDGGFFQGREMPDMTNQGISEESHNSDMSSVLAPSATSFTQVCSVNKDWAALHQEYLLELSDSGFEAVGEPRPAFPFLEEDSSFLAEASDKVDTQLPTGPGLPRNLDFSSFPIHISKIGHLRAEKDHDSLSAKVESASDLLSTVERMSSNGTYPADIESLTSGSINAQPYTAGNVIPSSMTEAWEVHRASLEGCLQGDRHSVLITSSGQKRAYHNDDTLATEGDCLPQDGALLGKNTKVQPGLLSHNSHQQPLLEEKAASQQCTDGEVAGTRIDACCAFPSGPELFLHSAPWSSSPSSLQPPPLETFYVTKSRDALTETALEIPACREAWVPSPPPREAWGFDHSHQASQKAHWKNNLPKLSQSQNSKIDSPQQTTTKRPTDLDTGEGTEELGKHSRNMREEENHDSAYSFVAQNRQHLPSTRLKACECGNQLGILNKEYSLSVHQDEEGASAWHHGSVAFNGSEPKTLLFICDSKASGEEQSLLLPQIQSCGMHSQSPGARSDFIGKIANLDPEKVIPEEAAVSLKSRSLHCLSSPVIMAGGRSPTRRWEGRNETGLLREVISKDIQEEFSLPGTQYICERCHLLLCSRERKPTECKAHGQSQEVQSKEEPLEEKQNKRVNNTDEMARLMKSVMQLETGILEIESKHNKHLHASHMPSTELMLQDLEDQEKADHVPTPESSGEHLCFEDQPSFPIQIKDDIFEDSKAREIEVTNATSNNNTQIQKLTGSPFRSREYVQTRESESEHSYPPPGADRLARDTCDSLGKGTALRKPSNIYVHSRTMRGLARALPLQPSIERPKKDNELLKASAKFQGQTWALESLEELESMERFQESQIVVVLSGSELEDAKTQGGVEEMTVDRRGSLQEKEDMVSSTQKVPTPSQHWKGTFFSQEAVSPFYYQTGFSAALPHGELSGTQPVHSLSFPRSGLHGSDTKGVSSFEYILEPVMLKTNRNSLATGVGDQDHSGEIRSSSPQERASGDVSTTHTPLGGSVMPVVVRASGQAVTSDSTLLNTEDWITVSTSSQEDQEGDFRDTSTGSTTQEALGSEAEATVQKERKNSSLDRISRQAEKRVSFLLQEDSNQGEEERQKTEETSEDQQLPNSACLTPVSELKGPDAEPLLLPDSSIHASICLGILAEIRQAKAQRKQLTDLVAEGTVLPYETLQEAEWFSEAAGKPQTQKVKLGWGSTRNDAKAQRLHEASPSAVSADLLADERKAQVSAGSFHHLPNPETDRGPQHHLLASPHIVSELEKRYCTGKPRQFCGASGRSDSSEVIEKRKEASRTKSSVDPLPSDRLLSIPAVEQDGGLGSEKVSVLPSQTSYAPGRILHGQGQLTARETVKGMSFGGKDSILGHQEPRSLDSTHGGGSEKISVTTQKENGVFSECPSVICTVDNAVDLSQSKQDHVQGLDASTGLEETKASPKSGAVHPEAPGNVGAEANIRHPVKWKNVDSGLACGGDSKNPWSTPFLDQRPSLHPSGVREEAPGPCPKECLVFERNTGGSRPLGSSYEEAENRTIPCPHLSGSQPTAAVHACCSHSSTLLCCRDGVLRKGTPWAAAPPDHSLCIVPSTVCEVDGTGERLSRVSLAHDLKHKCGPVDNSIPNPPTTTPVSSPAQNCSCLSTSEMRARCLTHTFARGRSVEGSGEETTGKKVSTAPEDTFPSSPAGMSSEPLRTLKNNSVDENGQASQTMPEPPAVTQGPGTLNSNECVDSKLVIAAQFGHLENTKCCSEKMQPSTKVRGHSCLAPQARFVDMLKPTCHPKIETSWEEEEQQRDQVSGDGKDHAQVRNLVPSNVGGFDGCQTRDGETKSSVPQTFFSDFEAQTEPSQPAAQTHSQHCSDREQLPRSHRHLLPVIAIFSGPKHARYSPRPQFTVVSSSRSLQELNLSVEPPSPTDEDAQRPDSSWRPHLRGHSSEKPVSTSLKTQDCSQKALCNLNNSSSNHRPLNPVIPPYPTSSTVSCMPTPEFMTTWMPDALEQAHQGKTDKLSVQGMPENWHSQTDKEMLHFGSSELSPSVLSSCPQGPVHIGWKQYVFGSAVDVSCSQKPQCLIQSNMAQCSSMDNVIEDKKSPFHSHPKTDAQTQDLPNIHCDIENDQSSNELPLAGGSATTQVDEILLLCPPETGCAGGEASVNTFEQGTQALGSRRHWCCSDVSLQPEARTMSDSELASWTSMHNLSVHLSQLLHSTSELLGSLSHPGVVIKEQNVKRDSLDEAQQALRMDGSALTTVDEGIQTDLALPPLAFQGPEVKSEEVSVILDVMDSGITTVAQEKGDVTVVFQKREAEGAAETPGLHEESTHNKLQSPPLPSPHLRVQKADLGQNFTFMSPPASPDGSPPPSLRPEESCMVVNMPRFSPHSGLSLGAFESTQEPRTQKRLCGSSAVLVDRASSPILTFSASIQELSNPLACVTLSAPSVHPLEDFQKLDDINSDLAVGDPGPPVDNSKATDESGDSQRAESLDREGKSPLGKSSERLLLDTSSPCSPQQNSSLQVSFLGTAPQQLQPKTTTGDQSKLPSPPPRHKNPKLDDSCVSEKVASVEYGPLRPSQWQGRTTNKDWGSEFMVEPQPNLDQPSSRRGLQPLSPCQISDTTGLQSPAVDPPQACRPMGLLCSGSHMHVAPGPQHYNLRDLPVHNNFNNLYGVQGGPGGGLHVGESLGVRCDSSSVGTHRPLQLSDKYSQNLEWLRLEHIPLQAGVQKLALSVELTEAKLHHGFGETDALLKVLQSGTGEVLAPQEPAVPSSEEFYTRQKKTIETLRRQRAERLHNFRRTRSLSPQKQLGLLPSKDLPTWELDLPSRRQEYLQQLRKHIVDTTRIPEPAPGLARPPSADTELPAAARAGTPRSCPMEHSPEEGASPEPSGQPPATDSTRDGGSGVPPAGPGAASEALAVLTSFGRRLLVLVPVYLAGAAGLSVGFVLFGLALYLGWRRVRDGKERSLRAARQLLDDEERITAETLYMSHRELPAWVSFPDVEKAEWLNKIVAQVWPFLGQYMEKLLAETVAPAVRGANPHLQTFTFTRVELGEKPLRIIGVKVHPSQRKDQILLDLNVSYVGDVQIDVEVKKYFCKAGVKGMQLHGVLRVILEPLTGDLPIVGAVSMFFIKRPTLDINWTGMTNLLDIPGLSSLSDTMIMDSIAAFLVLPNRLLVPLVPDLQDVAQLRSPLPRGIIRIHLLAARGLSSKDKYVKGLIEGKSDPYALVRVGTQTFCSRVIDEELNPHWGETYEVIVHEVPGQEIEVEVFDKDPDKDDFLGRMKLDVGKVLQAGVLDNWYPLQGGQGQVHLRLEWLSLLPDAEKLDQVLQWNRGITSRPEPPSAAILVVYLDRAQDLPLKKGNKEPNPMVQLSVQDVTRESKATYSTNSPVWEEAFRFFLQDPRSQELDVQVKDDSRALTLGALTLPLARLLTASELTLDQWFQLSSSGPNSRLYMKLVMRILYLDYSEIRFPTVPGAQDWDRESLETGSSVDAPPRPYHTTPNSHFGTENVLRIHVLEAQDLIAKDRFLGGLVKGKSDPYVKLKVAGKSFRTHVVREDLNPRWNEVFEVIVTSIPGQELEIEVFDKDLDKDDFLGRYKVSLTTVLNSGFLDEWLTLEDVPSGRLHLRLERLTPRPTAAELEEVLQVNSLIQTQKSSELAAALLSVFLERAEDLPLRKGTKPPSPYATITVGETSHKTKTVSQSSAPVWEESASFLIRKPHAESLELQVRGEGTGTLGSVSLPLSELLQEDQLCLDHWFALSGQGQVLMRAQLGILVSQHSGVEAHSHSYSHSHSSSSLNDEPEALGGPTHPASPVLEVRHRLTHGDSPSEAPVGPLGQVKLTVWYHSDEQKLISIIHSCRALRQNGRDLPDPYVSVLLLPDKNRSTKRKTPQKKRTLNPEFNERFEWDLPLDGTLRRKLDVSVKSNSSFMSRERELLGKVQLDLAEIDLSQGAAQWYDLMDDRDKGGS